MGDDPSIARWIRKVFPILLMTGAVSCQPQNAYPIAALTLTQPKTIQTSSPKPYPTSSKLPTPTWTPAPRPIPTAFSWTNFSWPAEVISPENADRLTQFTVLGQGALGQFTYSPDGSQLAVASSLGIHLYDAHTMTEERIFTTMAEIGSLAFSPDGTFLASGAYDGLIQIWELPTGRSVHAFYGHHYFISRMAFSPNGKVLATISPMEQQVGTWDPATGKRLQLLRIYEPSAVGFSADGKILAIADSEGVVSRYNLGNKQPLDVMPSGGKVVFSPEAGLLAAGTGEISLINVSDGSIWYSFADFPGAIPAAFSQDGKVLALIEPGRVVLWDVVQQAVVQTLAIDATEIALAPDGKQTAIHNRAILSEDSTIRIWDTAANLQIETLEGYHRIVKQIAFSPDNRTIEAGYGDGAVRIWNLEEKSERTILPPDSEPIPTFAFSPNGLWMAVSDWNKVSLRGLPDGTKLAEVALPNVRTLVFSSDGKLLAGISSTQGITIWAVAGDSGMRKLTDIPGNATRLVLSPDGRWVATITSEGGISIREISNGREIWGRQPSLCQLMDIVFLPSGDTLAAGGGCGTVGEWQSGSGTEVFFVNKYEQGVTSIAVSPDGRILSAGMYRSIALLHANDGSNVTQIGGFIADVFSQSFSPDGKILATGGTDGTIRLWGVRPQ